MCILLATKALQKKGARLDDDEESEHEQQDNDHDKENVNGPEAPTEEQKAKTKKAKKRKMVSTITKNPETLNDRLDTIPLTDPFFAKLNSIIGDTNSSKRLMQNIIPTEGSKLKLRQNIPIWDSNDQTGFDLKEQVDYRNPDPITRILSYKPIWKVYNLENLARFNVRLGLKDYRLSAEPMEQDDNDHQRSRWGDDFYNTVLNRSNHCELQFDINAAVEPVQFEQSMVMDFGDMNQDDFDEVDRIAIERCKGLKRNPVMIEDMQPVNCAKLEYSYRMLDQIDQFWAEPAHWKFRQSRRTNMSVGSRISSLGSKQSLKPNAQAKKAVRKRNAPKILQVVTLEDLQNDEEDMDGVILRITPRMKGFQLSNQVIARKWDVKKHKLPRDFKTPLDIFDKFENAASLHINSNLNATFTGDDEVSVAYDYNNVNDWDYCSRVDVQSDTETETNTDMGQMDNQEFDNPEMNPPPAPVDEIPDVFVGAPERIEKISIAFARRAKVVDMKQLKACSWNLLNNKHQADREHDPKFSETLRDLPKVLSRPMAESMSMPLAFYAVLHLCNDKSLMLNPVSDQLSDFEVHFVNDNPQP